MLDGYGHHQLTWDTCDERFGDVLVASPADAQGRGISLAVRQNGAAANLTGAAVYLVWRHKATGERTAESLPGEAAWQLDVVRSVVAKDPVKEVFDLVALNARLIAV